MTRRTKVILSDGIVCVDAHERNAVRAAYRGHRRLKGRKSARLAALTAAIAIADHRWRAKQSSCTIRITPGTMASADAIVDAMRQHMRQRRTPWPPPVAGTAVDGVPPTDGAA